ncbi:hypothetical protein [Flavobacterium taihuense]|uniref:Glycosyl transferase family 2 n=1 Tax=Flavobacterium taihuense TaxID=2857508 RepID=A0ABS6XZA2_9FLAO|nr:hypothetical protein [Flavobacterium taihuense]MBW4362003.1 hypothetical protein [Flavobacterium taihuense]
MVVKIGYLVSYDYEYLKYSLPLIYENKKVQEIILVIDKDRLTWSGNRFEIPHAFFEWIKSFDTESKIKIKEDTFYNELNPPMINENKERNFLYNKMGRCDWYIQLDCDEYFLDFSSFMNELEEIYLDKNKYHNTLSVCVKFANLFKKIEKGFLIISPIIENCWVATTNPICYYGRVNESNEIIESDTILVHQSWARNESEILQKITNWGHKNDFDSNSYFNLWKSLDRNNYRYIHNFHPLQDNDGVWNELKLLHFENIETLLDYSENKLRRIFNKSRLKSTKNNYSKL